MADEIGQFEVTADVAGASAAIKGMIEKLAHLPVAEELTAWQAEDMHRKYPQTDKVNPTTGVTRIYPRSRVESKSRKRQPRKGGVRLARMVRRAFGHRPILRPELLERLHERMMEMMKRELTWR